MQLLVAECMEAHELTQPALCVPNCAEWLTVGNSTQPTALPPPPPIHPPGRMLGYREANIRHHIQSTGGQLSSEVAAAVDAELAGLSAAPPSLPWTGRGSRRGKA